MGRMLAEWEDGRTLLLQLDNINMSFYIFFSATSFSNEHFSWTFWGKNHTTLFERVAKTWQCGYVCFPLWKVGEMCSVVWSMLELWRGVLARDVSGAHSCVALTWTVSEAGPRVEKIFANMLKYQCKKPCIGFLIPWKNGRRVYDLWSRGRTNERDILKID